jgi:predicted YcjX-like family ATPase
MSNQPTKMELPSVTMKKQQQWNEMSTLYNDCYNSLTGVVATVGTIVNIKSQLPESVDEVKLTNMVVTLNRNIETSRSNLNKIYQEMVQSQNSDMDMMDINMECIQIASNFNEWGVHFSTLCGQPLGDLINYIEQ